MRYQSKKNHIYRISSTNFCKCILLAKIAAKYVILANKVFDILQIVSNIIHHIVFSQTDFKNLNMLVSGLSSQLLNKLK